MVLCNQQKTRLKGKKRLLLAAVAVVMAVVAVMVFWLHPFRHKGMPHYVEDSVQVVLVVGTADTVALSEWMPTYSKGFFRKADGGVELRYGKCPVSLEGVSQDSVRQALACLGLTLQERLKGLEKLEDELRYYERTHTVVDDGYNQVMGLSTFVQSEHDSLLALQQQLARLDTARQWTVTTRHRIHCRPLALCLDSLPNFDVLPTDSLGYRYFAELQGDTLLRGTRLHYLTTDCLGPRLVERYVGDLDSLGRPCGEGVSHSSSSPDAKSAGCAVLYYDGEWCDGEREGFGIGLVPGRIVCVGSWHNDRFQGERIVYTVDRVYGIDISRYQHEQGRKKYPINWKGMRITNLGVQTKKKIDGRTDYPVSFCYIKATQGVSVKSAYAADDATQARRCGIHVGQYHFFSPIDGARQAHWFLQHASLHRGDMPPMLDIELSDRQIRSMGGVERMHREMVAWVRIVQAHCHTLPVLYLSQTFIDKYMEGAPDELRECPVWVARYNQYRPYVRLAFWQLSCDGRVRGIHGDVDIDVFNGSTEQFRAFCDDYRIR